MFFPNGENGFWVNHGGCKDRMGDFVGKELPDYVSMRFNLSSDRKDRYVFGISMGGYGALHTGLAYPESYSKIAAFAPALILYELEGAKPGFENAGGDYHYYTRVFGEINGIMESEYNPEQLIKNMKAEGTEIPGIFHCCGTEDFLLGHNRRFSEFVKSENLDYEYHESAGIHDYNFWNRYVEKAILWAIGEEAETKRTVSGLIV